MSRAGALHSVVQDRDGNLWTFGSNLLGQLGRPGNASTPLANWEPALFNASRVGGAYNDSSEVRLLDVAAGDWHALLRTVDRLGATRLWAWGSNEFGQLGTGVRVGKCVDPANAALTRDCAALFDEDEII